MSNQLAVSTEATLKKFNEMCEEDISFIFKHHGGMLEQAVYYTGKEKISTTEIISTRSDKWALEYRYNVQLNRTEAWIKATTKVLSDKENVWVREWLVKLGFDELEAMMFFSSNISNKRRIANEVAKLLLYRKGLCVIAERNPTFSPYALAAANKIQEMIFEFLAAAKASGRIS